MPKNIITPPSYPIDNVSQLADEVEGQAALVKDTFDKVGRDTRSYLINTLIQTIQGNDGARSIGLDLTNIPYDNTEEAIEYLHQQILGLMQNPVVLPPNSIFDSRLTDQPGNLKPDVRNSRNYSAELWSVNQKTADNGQNESLWTPSGNITVSADTINKMFGRQGVRFTATSTGASFGVATITGSFDFSKLLDGSDSDDDDYINIGFFIESLANVTDLDLAFKTNNSNRYDITVVPTVDGNNEIFELRKGDFVPTGSPDWSNITEIFIRFSYPSGSQNNYVMYQFIQTVKKHPEEAKPLYFQENGNVKANAENNVTILIAEEFGRFKYIVPKQENGVNEYIDFQDSFGDCIFEVNGSFENPSGDSITYGLKGDDDNRIYGFFNTNTSFAIGKVLSGSTDFFPISIPNISGASEFKFRLIRDVENSNVRAELTIGSEKYIENIHFNYPSDMVMSIRTRGNDSLRDIIDNMSITVMQNSDKANFAETAGNLEEQPKARVYNTANLSVPSGIATKQVFNASDVLNGFYLDSNNPSRLYANRKGRLLAEIIGLMNVSGEIIVIFYINGSEVKRPSKNSIGGKYFDVFAILDVSVGDYIEIGYLQTIGAGTMFGTTAFPLTKHLTVNWLG